MTQDLTAERIVQTFYNIGEAINANLGRQEILDHILQAVVEELGYKAASVRVLDPERQTLEIRAATGLSESYLRKGPVEVTQSPIDREVLQGEIVSLDDTTHDARWQYPEAALAEGIRSVLAAPIRIRGRHLGVFRVYTAELHAFDQTEQLLIATVANLIARTLRNMQFYHTIHAIAADINSSLELKKVLQALLNNVTEQTSCKAALIRLLGPKKEHLHLAAARGLSDRYLQKGEVAVAESPIDRQVLQGQVAMIANIQNEPSLQYPQEAIREGIRSVLTVPLAVREQIIGVLRVYSAQEHRFNDDEIEFLRTVADLGAIAIDNARLYETLSEKYKAAREDWAGWYRFLALS